MRSNPSSFRPFQARGPRLAAAFAAFAFLAPAAGAQTMQWFGDWEAAPLAATELYVSPAGVIGNPGTLALPCPSITAALASPAGVAALGVQPLTINLLPGNYLNEIFPIALPVHGVCIEAYTLNGAPLPVVNASLATPAVPETFLFNTLGNPALPDSALRGVEIRNDAIAFNSAQVRIAVPAGLEVQRVAPEIRFCDILGGANFGIDIVGAAETNLEAVIEGNLIAPAPTKEGNPMVGVRVTGSDAPTSPLIRANRIRSYETNVLLQGGGLSHATRLQANFIQVGESNVVIDGCSPYVVGNTIAFAFSLTATPVGIAWTNMNQLEMTLSNNLIWNPDHGGMGIDPVDVTNDMSVFLSADRGCFNNYEQDDFLAGTAWPNFGPLTNGFFPNMVGLDGGAGTTITDLHLMPGSLLRELGVNFECQPFALVSPTVPGAPAPILVRRDHAFDGDFDARISLVACDIGADEVTDLLNDPSGTRGASIRRRVGSTLGNDIDAVGNLSPDVNGDWASEIEVVGTPGDLVLILSGVGFLDVVPDPSLFNALVENTAIYQNFLADAVLLPGMATQTSICVDLNGGSATVAVIPIAIGGTGVEVVPFTFGAFNPAFVEAEAHFQAIAFDSTVTWVQSTNRLSLDLNE